MKFTLNGQSVSLPKEWREDRLLWVLRDHFNLIGPKYGCGIGECGACTIHLDGEAVRSCSMTAGDVEGASITTLEGLQNQSGQPHPVQKAWMINNVPQCGFCQNGQIMTAAALYNSPEKKSDEDVIEEMARVRCRCGTQVRIQKALKDLKLGRNA